MNGNEPMYRRILVPTDFSDHSRRAVDHATGLARAMDAEIILFHAFDRPAFARLPAGDAALRSYLDRAYQEATERLEQWVGQCEGVRCRAISTQGRPWIEILATADREQADLICMSTHGRTPLVEALLGGVTERVLHRARCPVLVVRPPGEAWELEKEAE